MNRTGAQAGRRKYYSRYFSHYTKKYYSLLALGALFLAGVLLGALLLRTAGEDTIQLLLRMVNGFVENRRDQTLLQNFTSGAVASLLFLGVLFVCGFCAIAQPVIVLLPLFRGVGIGFSMATLYAAHGTGALGYVALLMLPGTVITTLAILVCCRESMRLSSSFFAVMGGGEHRDGPLYSPRIYLARFFACGVLCMLSAFLEAVLYHGFANFFVLS